MKINLNEKYSETFKYLTAAISFKPEVALILGSGLGKFASTVHIIKTFNCNELPGYPPSTVEGHAGKIHFAEYNGKNILLFQGRIHFYEGYKIEECLLPVFISYKLGAKKIILTNAAGGTNPSFVPGDLMLNSSFISFTIKKELMEFMGLPSSEIIQNINSLPSEKINNIVRSAASEVKVDLKEGIYWLSKGPTYETPAEVKMAIRLGADAVGMSTVHEAFFAASLGLETSAISCITNYAAGLSDNKLSHSEVTETALLVEEKFEKLIKKIIQNI